MTIRGNAVLGFSGTFFLLSNLRIFGAIRPMDVFFLRLQRMLLRHNVTFVLHRWLCRRNGRKQLQTTWVMATITIKGVAMDICFVDGVNRRVHSFVPIATFNGSWRNRMAIPMVCLTGASTQRSVEFQRQWREVPFFNIFNEAHWCQPGSIGVFTR